MRTLLRPLLLLIAACAAGAAEPGDANAPGLGDVGAEGGSREATRWPRSFLAGPGTGPALYLDESPQAPAIGYLSEGALVRLRAFPENGRVAVNVLGGMKVRAHLDARRLALRVRSRGALAGTPIYFGPGDYVRVFGPDPQPGLMRVEAQVDLGRGPEVTLPAFRGTFDEASLSTEVPADVEALPEGTAMQLPAGVAVPLYASPSEVSAQLPALDPPLVVSVLRDRGRWKGVRVGVGPYLVGYIDTEATPLTPAEALPRRATPAPTAGGVPRRIRGEDAGRALLRIAAGTRVSHGEGRIVAILQEAGFGREWERFDDTNEVDVFLAVDDQVAVRGLVPASAVSPAP